ncbi:MAG: APC family permease [Actinomycetota bacterium]|nr:APC family permease [Actinomycetota bacterium]
MAGEHPLRRSLGLHDAVAIGLGSMIGAGVFAVWAPAAATAGPWLLLSLALAAFVAACNALSSAALAVRYPTAGGTYVYGRERLGDLPGYLAGWCFVIGKVASCAAMAMTVGAYLVPEYERVSALVAVVVVTLLNLSGVQRSAGMSRVIVTAVLAVLAGVVVAALLRGAGGPGWSGGVGDGTVGGGSYAVLQAAGLLFFAFAGYARIATLAEEVEHPERVIPRAVTLSLTVVLVVYAAVGITLLGVIGAERVAGSSAPVAELAEQVWGSSWSWLVRVAAGVAALGALLNLVLGISRTSMAMARGGHLPAALGRIGRRHQTPRVAEIVVGVVVLGVVLVADLRGAIGFSSFGVLLYYAIANASAWTLRGDWGAARLVPPLGLAGCLTLALTLPWGSVLGGAGLIAVGLLWYAVRGSFGVGRATRSGPSAG